MKLPKVLFLETGEDVTAFVNGAESSSDKGAGLVGLTLFESSARSLHKSVLRISGSSNLHSPAPKGKTSVARGEMPLGNGKPPRNQRADSAPESHTSGRNSKPSPRTMIREGFPGFEFPAAIIPEKNLDDTGLREPDA
ncbi:MAG: hypothetical protein ACI8UZ_002349 [Akkermansiaceae bacterium]|jgi:hypothetical protein